MSNTVTIGDLLLLTRYVMRFERAARRQKCCDVLARVCDAKAYLKITGHAHPFYGDGSISALSLRLGVGHATFAVTEDLLDAFSFVLADVSTFVSLLRRS